MIIKDLCGTCRGACVTPLICRWLAMNCTQINIWNFVKNASLLLMVASLPLKSEILRGHHPPVMQVFCMDILQEIKCSNATLINETLKYFFNLSNQSGSLSVHARYAPSDHMDYWDLTANDLQSLNHFRISACMHMLPNYWSINIHVDFLSEIYL